jgi:hypothetical protein
MQKIRQFVSKMLNFSHSQNKKNFLSFVARVSFLSQSQLIVVLAATKDAISHSDLTNREFDNSFLLHTKSCPFHCLLLASVNGLQR